MFSSYVKCLCVAIRVPQIHKCRHCNSHGLSWTQTRKGHATANTSEYVEAPLETHFTIGHLVAVPDLHKKLKLKTYQDSLSVEAVNVLKLPLWAGFATR